MSDDEDNIVKLVIDNEKYLPTTFHKIKGLLWTLSIRRNEKNGKFLEVECNSLDQHPYWDCLFSVFIDLFTENGKKAENIVKVKKFSNYTKVAAILPLEDDISTVVLNLRPQDMQVHSFTKSDLFDEPLEHISDFNFIIEGQKLYACKKILATYSKLFYKWFYKNLEPVTEFKLGLHHSCNYFRIFLGLLYQQLNLLNEHNVQTVAAHSNRFKVKHCLEECEKFLIMADMEPQHKLMLAGNLNFKVMNCHILSNTRTVKKVMKIIDSTTFVKLHRKTKVAIFDRLAQLKSGKKPNPANIQFKPRSFEFNEKRRHLTDVVLSVGGKKFYVSKQLMAFKSSYFHALFYSDFKEKKEDIIELKEVDADEFEMFLQFVHHMSQVFDEDNFENILKLSQMYGTEVVTKKCEDFIRNEQDMTDVMKIILADRYNLPTLFDDIALKIRTQEDYRNLSKMEGFERLSMETLGKISMKLLS